MIQANELRIGNLITTIFSSDVSEVNRIIKQRVKDGYYVAVGLSAGESYIPENLSGVSLTEEWLLKFGFKNIYGNWYFNPVETEDEKGDDAYGTDFSLVGDNGYYLSESLPFNQKGIKFVHQLQNLYYALTGEELTINGNATEP